MYLAEMEVKGRDSVRNRNKIVSISKNICIFSSIEMTHWDYPLKEFLKDKSNSKKRQINKVPLLFGPLENNSKLR